ncbi:hypothetical protein BDQ17DRAFT_1261025 [Cyathus striatus]|nr:hypothetical protein BDQ17DRAFT_1261025 [Cyathus striatus]
MEQGRKPTPRNTKWCSSCKATLVSTLKKEAQKEKQSDTGWKKSTWTACVVDLKGSELICGGAPKKASSCRDHWGNMKVQAKVVRKLQELSGFGWGDEAKCVTAPDNVWDAYIVV